MHARTLSTPQFSQMLISKQYYFSAAPSICVPTPSLPNRSKCLTLHLRTGGKRKGIEPVDSHILAYIHQQTHPACRTTQSNKPDRDEDRDSTHISTMEPTKPKPHDNNKVGENQRAPLEIIALPLPNHPTHQKHRQNRRHHVPLGKDQREGVPQRLLRRGRGWGRGEVFVVDTREEDEGGDLEEDDLQGVGGADFHGQSDVAVHGEGDGVEEFGGVGHEGEEGDAEEFLSDVHVLEHAVHGVDEDFRDHGVGYGGGEEDRGGFGAGPVGGVVASGLFCALLGVGVWSCAGGGSFGQHIHIVNTAGFDAAGAVFWSGICVLGVFTRP